MTSKARELVTTDSRGRVLLSGHKSEQFLMQENEDGSILLEPAVVMTSAQAEYNNSPELQALLAVAANSPTVTRKRSRRR